MPWRQRPLEISVRRFLIEFERGSWSQSDDVVLYNHSLIAYVHRLLDAFCGVGARGVQANREKRMYARPVYLQRAFYGRPRTQQSPR